MVFMQFITNVASLGRELGGVTRELHQRFRIY